MTRTFQHKDIFLHYRKIGSGEKTIVAFHGFTRSSEDYEMFEPFLGKDYSIYAIDLFYHGRTRFASRNWKSFSKDQLKDILSGFLQHENIDFFSVVGYSMGGRVALFMLEQFPNKLEGLYLLAPDGLKTNFWNWLVTNTRTGKGIYGLAISNPGIVYSISNTGQRLNLLPRSINKFLDINFSTKGMRLRVYRVWQLYKEITFSQSDLAKYIIFNNIPTHLVVGHKDPVVKPALVEDFYQKIPKQATFHLVKAGHDLFRPHIMDYLSKEVFK